MDKVLRQYESTFIVNASLDDGQVDGVIGRVQEVITKGGGTVDALNKWGRKRLSYTINKKTNGFYVNLEFTAPSTLILVLDRAFQLDEMILRYLTIIVNRKALAARAKAAAAAAAAKPPEEAPAVPAREPLFQEGTGDKKP
jgi:small subunit ribosomal protein S6